ncbi:phosphoribosylformylglycinamidine synthase subunit PurL [Salibacter halophilus]|uniref:Phosphoribosylformylglycinamidine synthase subunit PurL n=1 Tax=Salibacter halophilus TaxID=1803916 RepID=A0A6N6M525_9FLAO|nr:phosphoribosylformylglycinamidine synthase subunit PurL [Salibacter halophilus]KAB1062130.1 phosphoribosylformylglycinamidine synthase subunit PurL [Salibacter halophilus]
MSKNAADTVIATKEQAIQLGLLGEEYEKVKEILGREPNFCEVSIYSAMWSEHCSYKNSIVWLKTLPKKGPHLLAEAGEENAGLVDIGDGLACAFKIESHNHPSAIEPYQGAATGVGGINRDIFTMGARPIAQMNSLRFGDLKLDKTKWLLKGVVKGIGNYGNSFGVPVLSGETFFDESFNTNPLVNAFSAGIVEVGKTLSATSHGAGNPVYIVGSATGKDGIHGAAFASKDITDASTDDLPSVQVGDPFQEKLLLEATLELADTDAVVGMQDMGAAGITCSTAEMSAEEGFGMDIDLDKVPTRQDGMHGFEILLSESQERMLVVVKKGKEKVVEDIFEKWDLNAVQIGEVTEGGVLNFHKNGELIATTPAEPLVLGGGAPVYEREYSEPAYFKEYQKFTIASIEEPKDLKKVAEFLIQQPNIASKNWISEQYDSMVGTANMTTNEPADAGVAQIKGSDRAIAMSVDCNSRYVNADPYKGTQIAVCEAARNIVCTGGKPSAISNCLNFGNPYNPESYWQFVKAVQGMGSACEALKTPVTGGNVSFYNQTVTKDGEVPVFPTPTIGMIGLLNKENKMSLDFKKESDMIYVIGENHNDISSSEYLAKYHGVKESPAPYFDLESEQEVQDAVLKLIEEKLIVSAHDCSNGGLFTTLLESAVHRDLGFNITTDQIIRKDAFLFGEAQSRVVVSVPTIYNEDFMEMMTHFGIDYSLLGYVTKGDITIDDESWGDISHFKSLYNEALEKALD